MKELTDWIVSTDRELFVSLNQLHLPWLDNAMYYFSQFWVWIPVYVLIILLIVRKWKKESVWIVLSVIIGLILTDYLSNTTKYIFERLRPTHDPELQHLVYIVKGYVGGTYGFISSHSANYFGVAMLSSLFIRNTGFTIFVFVWASLIAYSRIYLGVHFPLDVVGGMILGMSVSFLVFYIHTLIKKKLIAEIKSRFF